MDDNTCRACLSTINICLPVFSSHNEILTEFSDFKKMFRICANLEVDSDDTLPKSLCSDCITQLTTSYNFRKKCIQSDRELRNSSFSENHDFNYISLDHIFDSSIKGEQPMNLISAVYPCRKCFKYFTNFDDLTMHNLEHPQQENMNLCCYCGEYSQSMRLLMHHINKCHFEEHQLECGYCSFNCLTESDMGNHLMVNHCSNGSLESVINLIADSVEEVLLGEVEATIRQSNEVQMNRNDDNEDTMIDDDIISVELNDLDSLSVSEEESNAIVFNLEDNSTIENRDSNIIIDELPQEENEIVSQPTTTTSKKNKYKCVECPRVFKFQSNLTSHKKTHSKIAQNCPVCDETFFSAKSLQHHVTSHNPDKPFRCTIESCKFAFTNEASLKTHIIVNHENKDGKNQCIYCDKRYKMAKHLRAHLITHRAEKRFKCRHCPKSFHLAHHFKNHELIHLNNRQFLCSECGKSFISKDRLSLHQRIHSSKRKYKCEQCPKMFITKYQLDIHQSNHTNERPFMCNICGLRYKLDAFLKAHIRRKHNETKSSKTVRSSSSKVVATTPKVSSQKVTRSKKLTTKIPYCTICSTNFTTINKLENHMKIHSFAYSCNVCAKPFALEANLTSHMKIHERYKKKYPCKNCAEVYSRPDHLRYHKLRVHTNEKPFQCELCHKGFVQSCDLKVHVRRHTGERPFVCTICPKSFITSTTLNAHVRSHTGERPYPCGICDKRYLTSAALTTHIQTHNKMKAKIIEETE